MNNKTFIISGTGAGLLEHYVGLMPRSILDHYQSDTKYFKSYRNTFSKIYSDRGIQTFYKLNYPMLTSISFAHIWLFGFYELHKKSDSTINSIFYSSIAKFGHDVIMIPGDTIRMINNVSGNTTNNIIKNIYLKNGLTGFFKSSPITLLMNMPVGLTEFITMKYLMNKYDNSTINIYIFGGIAGILSSIISNPLDIIKTNIQLQGFKNQYSNKLYPNYYSMYCLCKNTYRKNGIIGLFRGSMLRSFQTSLCFGTYELINNQLLKT